MYFFNLDLSDSTISKNLDSEIILKLSQIDKEFDPSPWAYNTWEKLSEQALEVLFVLNEGQEPIGLAVFRSSPEEGLAHLLKLLIIPNRRRERLGETLLAWAFETLQGMELGRVYLEVEKGNPAIFLYRKMGLKKIHEIRDFYGPGRPGIVMISDK